MPTPVRPSLPKRVRTTFWRSTELALERHEKLLEHYRSLPAFWAADIRNMADALQRRALKDDSVAFREYQKSPDLLAAVECARADLARLGELFVAWPALWEAAALLRARGVRLSRAL